jgi:serine/threonine-protein kinase
MRSPERNDQVIFGQTLSWLFGASHVPTLEEINRFLLLAVSQALLLAGSFWLVYFALEPYMRRRWPDAIISWGRILGGNLRDPLVARDVLVGILFSIFGQLFIQFENLVRLWRDLSPVGPSHVQTLLGGRYLASVWLWQLIRALVFPLLFFFLMFLLWSLTRRQWLSMSLFVLLYLTSGLPAISDPLVALPFRGLMLLALAFCLLRFGFLTVAVATFVNGILYGSPITTDFSAWYAGNGLLALLAVMALALYAFYTSLGGQKVFTGKLLEE